MAPYDRLLGRDDAGNPVANKIPIHQFQAAVAEWSRAKLTGVQANSIITAVSGAPLTPAEQPRCRRS
jgi:S1-C subfamily serine protease